MYGSSYAEADTICYLLLVGSYVQVGVRVNLIEI